MEYKILYQWGVEQLQKAGISEAQLDARLLLEWCCGTDRNTLLVHGERVVSLTEYECYVNCISKREKHIPLQHITGVQEFMGLEFTVNEHVLIPRQDTEILVEEVMRHLHDGMRILDMCTGSGCILLSLLYYSNDCIGLGVDISEEALQIAGENAEKIKKQKAGEQGKEMQVSFLQSNLFEQIGQKKQAGQLEENAESEQSGVPEQFEIIVSNPPYIRRDVIETLMPEVREHEPLMALDGKEDGLSFYHKITKQAGKYLTGGGMLFFEIGYDQGSSVKQIMEEAGFKEVEIIKDFAGLDRVVCGKC